MICRDQESNFSKNDGKDKGIFLNVLTQNCNYPRIIVGNPMYHYQAIKYLFISAMNLAVFGKPCVI
jgi:hypothetical protein